MSPVSFELVAARWHGGLDGWIFGERYHRKSVQCVRVCVLKWNDGRNGRLKECTDTQ